MVHIKYNIYPNRQINLLSILKHWWVVLQLKDIILGYRYFCKALKGPPVVRINLNPLALCWLINRVWREDLSSICDVFFCNNFKMSEKGCTSCVYIYELTCVPLKYTHWSPKCDCIWKQGHEGGDSRSMRAWKWSLIWQDWCA